MGARVSEGLARAVTVLHLAEAPGTPLPYSTAHWVSYGADEAIFLALVLLVVAGGFAYAGKRLRAPIKITPPGRTVTWFMIAIWLLAIYAVIIVSLRLRVPGEGGISGLRCGPRARRHVLSMRP